MEFTEAVRRRRMVRRYDPDRPVAPDVVDDLLQLAVRAPSAGFSQGWQFLVLADRADRDRFWAATTPPDTQPAAQPEVPPRAEPEAQAGVPPEPGPDGWLAGLRTAPVLVLALSDQQAYLDRYAEPDKGWIDRDVARWPVPYWDIDTGMASMIFLLGVVDRGLAACFFGVPPEFVDSTRAAFAIPERLRFVGVISLGYGAPDRRSPSLKRGHRELGEVVSYGRFGVRAPAAG